MARRSLKQTALTLLVASMCLTAVAATAFPLFASHKGRSREWQSVRGRIKPLIFRYRDETGRWPKSWQEIVSRYHPDLAYDYSYDCDYHPWGHVFKGTLEGASLVLVGVVHNDAEYKVKTAKMNSGVTVFMDR